MPKRAKAYFRVECDVLVHPATALMASDNDLLAMWTRLGIMAVQRMAAQHGDEFVATKDDLMAAAGKARIDAAVRLGRELERLGLITLGEFGQRSGRRSADVAQTSGRRPADVRRTSRRRPPDVCSISFRNLSKRQRFGGQKGSPQEPRAKGQEPRAKSQIDRASASPAGAARSRGKSPDDDSALAVDEQRAKIAEYPPEIRDATRKFHEHRRRCWPGIQPPTPAAQVGWLRDMDRLVRLGPIGGEKKPVSIEQIEHLCSLIFNPEGDSEVAAFWRSVIKSPKKLRKHWEDILIQLQREANQQRSSTPDGKRERDERAAQERRRGAARRRGKQQRGGDR